MKYIILTITLSLSIFYSKAQNIRTFSNIELGTGFSDQTQQYSFFYGESIQVNSKVPFRFTTGLRYSLNNKNKGTYDSHKKSTLPQITFNNRIWYNTFAIPVGVEFFYKSIGIGAFQEVASFSGNKSYDSTSVNLEKKQILKTQGFSGIFGSKQNLTGGVYLVYTFSDSFSFKLGYNRMNTTFTKSNDTKTLGYSTLKDDTFSIGLRLNIEK